MSLGPILLVILVSAMSPPRSADHGGLNAEWLSKDQRVASQLSSHLPPQQHTAEAFLSVVGSSDRQFSWPLGFGVHRHEAWFHGGYVSWSLQILAYQGNIAAVRVHGDLISETDEQRIAFAGAIRKVTRRGFEFRNQGVWYEYSSIAVLQAARDKIALELGAVDRPKIPNPVREHFDLLMDPFEEPDYGSRCYFSGQDPPGRVAMSALVESRQVELLTVLLRSMTPAARWYAVEGLSSLEKVGVTISEADRRAMKRILTSDVPIAVCEGCMVSRKIPRGLESEDTH